MLDRKCWPVLAAEGVLLVGPEGAETPVSDVACAGVALDERWTVVSPRVPDRPPSDGLAGHGRDRQS